MKNLVKLFAIVFSFLSLGFVSCSDDKNDLPPTDPPAANPAKSAMEFTLPDFSESYVYTVKNLTTNLAEICKEYIPDFSKEKQAIVVYPYNKDGKVDYTMGFVTDNGGSIRWNEDGTYVYKTGNTSAITTLYIDSCKILTTADTLNAAVVHSDQLKDYDGNLYGIVKIGRQYWITSNLKVTRFNDGKKITTGLSDDEWDQNTTGAYSVYDPNKDFTYDPSVGNKPIPDDINTPAKIIASYGLLYNWNAASSSQVIPDGWALPTKENVDKLNSFLANGAPENESTAGGMMKEAGLIHWDAYEVWDDKIGDMVSTGENKGATNVCGFAAVGSGNFSWGYYSSIKKYFEMWTSSEALEDWEIELSYKLYFKLTNDSDKLKPASSDKSDLKSIRLIRK